MTADTLRADLWRLTGYKPDQAFSGTRLGARTLEDGTMAEEWRLGGGTDVPATLLRPARPGPHPAVLYCHAHGGDYHLGRREMLGGSRYLADPPYGPVLAGLGFVVLAIDMPGFGDRQGEGTEASLSKALLWQGKNLFGAMLADLAGALGFLLKQEDVRQGHVFTLGLSMGAAHATWLAALDARVGGCVGLCMLADVSPMIASGLHDKHGYYLTVPGFLAIAEMGDVAGLIAPRPQLICHGGQDHLTPPEARDPALVRVAAAYGQVNSAGSDLVTMIDEAAGHGESAAMRVAALDFLERAAARPAHFSGI